MITGKIVRLCFALITLIACIDNAVIKLSKSGNEWDLNYRYSIDFTNTVGRNPDQKKIQVYYFYNSLSASYSMRSCFAYDKKTKGEYSMKINFFIEYKETLVLAYTQILTTKDQFAKTFNIFCQKCKLIFTKNENLEDGTTLPSQFCSTGVEILVDDPQDLEQLNNLIAKKQLLI
jgi:hypothetical protein